MSSLHIDFKSRRNFDIRKKNLLKGDVSTGPSMTIRGGYGYSVFWKSTCSNTRQKREIQHIKPSIIKFTLNSYKKNFILEYYLPPLLVCHALLYFSEKEKLSKVALLYLHLPSHASSQSSALRRGNRVLLWSKDHKAVSIYVMFSRY